MKILKPEIQAACGCLQTCTGIKSGIEATIHASREIWNDPSTECLLQVHADNAFNRLNRKVALHNISEVCPALQRYLHNHYQKAAKLTFSDESNQASLNSEEGCTQGDPAAMSFYGCGITPLVVILSSTADPDL